MGTNYYIKRKLSDNQKQIIIDKLMKDEYEDVHFMLPENIHIGKRSSGWKFLWDVHGFKYFNPTKESIFDFLKSGTIIDEYRQEVSFDDFINNGLEDAIIAMYQYPSNFGLHCLWVP